MPNVVVESDFARLRRDAGLYVDKTWFIEAFLRNPALPDDFTVSTKAVLFARPGGFGKTLFLTMLAEFFDLQKDSRDIFSGLQVLRNEKLCRQWMNSSPVIFLDFSHEGEKDFDSAMRSIGAKISGLCRSRSYLLESERVDDVCKETIRQCMDGDVNRGSQQDALKDLVEAMECHHGKKVVLLIDDYDAPLSAAARHGFGQRMTSFLSTFYLGALKDNRALGFAVLTGKLPFSSDSIFTGHNVVCFDTAEEPYADLFGFTQDEVDHLLVGAGLEERRNDVRERFGGWHFGDREDIHDPAGVMRHLACVRETDPTGPAACRARTLRSEPGKGLIRRFAGRRDIRARDIRAKLDRLLAGQPVAARIRPHAGHAELWDNPDAIWTALFAEGWLTRACAGTRYPGIKKANDTVLVVPNREMRSLLLEALEGRA